MKIFKILLVLCFFTSCLKTAEQINSEKKTVVREEQSQKMLADLMVKTKTLEEQVSVIQGNFQEISYKGKNEENLKKNSMDDLKIVVEEQDRKIKSLEKELEGQKKFIKNVTKTLKKLSKALLK